MHQPYSKIIQLLKASNVPFQVLEHEFVRTSEEAAKIRGLSAKQGGKSLLVKADNSFVLCVIPGDKRLDSKKVRQLLAIRKLHFATPEEVFEVMGCEVGACYPFGNLLGIPMYVDTSLSQNELISFSCGVHTKSVVMKWKDYEKAVQPNLVDVIQ